MYELMTCEPLPRADLAGAKAAQLVDVFSGSVPPGTIRDAFSEAAALMERDLEAVGACVEAGTFSQLDAAAGELRRWFRPARGESIPAVLALWALLASCGDSNETLNRFWNSRAAAAEDTAEGQAAVLLISAVAETAAEDERDPLVAGLWQAFVDARSWFLRQPAGLAG